MIRLPFLHLCAAALLAVPFAVSAGPDDAYVVEEIKLPKGFAPEIGALAFNSKGELVVVSRR